MARLTGALALALALIIVPLAIPRAAHAQQPGQGPPLPLAIDLKKVAIGSWAEYGMNVGQTAPMKMRMALVGRSGASNTFEMSVEGGMLAMAGRIVTQTVVDVDPTKESSVKKIIMQIADNDPMDMPLDGGLKRQFVKPDPKSLVKSETIKVAAGSFKTKHYRDKTPQGDPFDFWVSPDAPPLGLVKVEIAQGPTPAGKGPIRFELTGLGKNAKVTITKPAKPMDQATLVKEIMGGAGLGSAPPSGPPPAKN